MKIVLIVAGVLMALIVLVVIVGYLLPKTHEATRTARFRRPAQDVWDALLDYPAHAAWRTGVSAMTRLEDRDGHEVWKEQHGRGDAICYEVVEREAPARLVTRIVDHRQFGGTWTWVIAPEATPDAMPDGADACTVTITENGEIYNPVFRIVSRFIMGYDHTMTQYLTELATHFEEPIQFED